MCLLSCIFSRAQDYINDIPQQRLVFFVQHLVGQLETSIPASTVVAGQVMVVLAFVLPVVKEIYGPFWSSILEQIQKTGAQADFYALHASLRLLSILRRSCMLESNDDLHDAWTEKRTAVASCLVDLLQQLQGKRRFFSDLIVAFGLYEGYNTALGNHLNAKSMVHPPLLTT